MTTQLMTLALPLAGTDPPSEFRIFRRGVNKSRKGPFVFDDEAAKRVMEAYQEHGLARLNFDYAHAQLKNVPVQDQVSAGTWVPEVRPGPELWATQIEWTASASQGIRNKEWLYFSPAFDFDGERRVTRMINCALTNIPALDDILPLTACRLSETLQQSFGDITDKIHKALSVRVGGVVPSIEAVWDDHFVYEIEDRYYWQGYHLETDAIVFDGAPIEVKEEFVPVPQASALDERTATAVQQTTAETRDRPVSNGQKGTAMTAVLSMVAMLGLAETAGEAEVLTEVGRLQSSQREILSLTGTATLDEAKGAILGWKASAEAYTKASAELAELKETAKKEARETLLKANTRKFSPAMLAEDGWVKDATIEMLQKFVKTAPDLIPAEEPVEPQVTRATLSDDERSVARQLGLTEQQYADSRAALEKGGAQ